MLKRGFLLYNFFHFLIAKKNPSRANKKTIMMAAENYTKLLADVNIKNTE